MVVHSFTVKERDVVSMPDKCTLKIRAYNVIKEKIVSCELAPGSPISEQEFMAEIGVSRTPIREALSLLATEKLVKIFPKRGIFVTDITEKEVIDLYTMRICLESTAIRMAMPYLDKVADIDYFIDLYSSRKYSPTIEEHLAIDRQFHLRLARATRNEYMYEAIANMYDLNARIRHRFISYNNERMEQSRREHLLLLGHLKRRAGARAGNAMRNHIKMGMKGALSVPSFIMAGA